MSFFPRARNIKIITIIKTYIFAFSVYPLKMIALLELWHFLVGEWILLNLIRGICDLSKSTLAAFLGDENMYIGIKC